LMNNNWLKCWLWKRVWAASVILNERQRGVIKVTDSPCSSDNWQFPTTGKSKFRDWG
jgi:hypothetical protein